MNTRKHLVAHNRHGLLCIGMGPMVTEVNTDFTHRADGLISLRDKAGSEVLIRPSDINPAYVNISDELDTYGVVELVETEAKTYDIISTSIIGFFN